MKRLFLLVAVVGALFTAAFAAAESVGVNAGTLQTGTDAILGCDPNDVTVTWTAGTEGDVTGVTVGDVDAACDTQNALLSVVVYSDIGCSDDPVASTPQEAVTGSNPVMLALTALQVEAASCVRVQLVNNTP